MCPAPDTFQEANMLERLILLIAAGAIVACISAVIVSFIPGASYTTIFIIVAIVAIVVVILINQ